MRKFIGMAICLLLSACFAAQAQTDYKAKGYQYVANSDYANAKMQFEAAKAMLQSKNADKNSAEFIEIEKLISYADESQKNRLSANQHLSVIQEGILTSTFAQCSSESEAEAKKESLMSTVTNARNALSKIVRRFPADKVARAQLSECNDAEEKINSLMAGFPEILAWKDATTENTLAAYESFLKKYPAGNYAQSAESEIFNIRETSAWAMATNANSYDGYNDYISNFPDGPHAAEARKSAYNIRMEESWVLAQSMNTTSAYLDYIAKYPDSKHLATAKKSVAECKERDSWEMSATLNTVDAYNDYISKYPKGKYAADARIRINKISEAAVWENVEKINTIDAYEQYLRTSTLLAYKDDALSHIAAIKHAEEVAADDKRWERIAKSKNPEDFNAYINSNGYKGHLNEARGLEKLMLARNTSLTSSNAETIADNYALAATYIKLDASDTARMNKAAEMAKYAEFDNRQSRMTAYSYLSAYPNGEHATQISDYVAKTLANSMTYDSLTDYERALSYAKSPSVQQYVKSRYQSLIRQKIRTEKKSKREPVHWSAGLQATYNYGLKLKSEVFTLNNHGYDWNMQAKEVLKPKLDYGILVGLGGHSNRFNLEAGYNFASYSVLVRPKINIAKKRYHGLADAKPRRGNDYSLCYFYVAPEARYYFKPIQYIMAPIETDQERADSYGYVSTTRLGAKLDYGVNIGFGIHCFDIYLGYLIPNNTITAGLAIYFSNK